MATTKKKKQAKKISVKKPDENAAVAKVADPADVRDDSDVAVAEAEVAESAKAKTRPDVKSEQTAEG
ncbi:MAG: hypothetical protein DRP66_00740, partial [Planctomycetota bacterium]